MIARSAYSPSMEEFSDHIDETVSLDVDPNSVFKLPEGCSFVVPGPDGKGPDQLLLVLSKHAANTARTAFGSPFLGNGTFSPFRCSCFPADQFCGFVASIKERDSFNTELGLQLTVVVKIHYSLTDDPRFPRSCIYARLNAYSSRALLAHDFTAIRVGSPVSGLIEKALSNPHTAQLAA